MKKRFVLIAIAGGLLFGLLAAPASAQNESWSLGAGYFTLPNVSGDVDDSGLYGCVAMMAENYRVEFDYGFDSPNITILSADYLYPLSQEENYLGGNAYIGAGYTYFSADELDSESGFNVLVGANFSGGLMGTIRYDILGSDQETFTIGVTYSFR
jgi:hypothetical protein